MTIKTITIGDCWVNCINKVLSEGKLEKDEDVDILEVLGLSIFIDKPYFYDEIIAKYGDPYVIDHTMQKFSKGIVMKDRPFTYADRIYNKRNIDQFEWIINRIKNKKESKSATICLLDEGTLDANIPCLTTIDVKIRDNKLNLQFFYRSQNILGRQYANLLALAKLQYDFAKRLNVDVGFLSGYIASAHIYKYDLEFAQSICEKKNVVIKDLFYIEGPTSIRQRFNSKTLK